MASFNKICLDTAGVCSNRIRVLSCGQGTDVCLEVELADTKAGAPVDLTAYGIGVDDIVADDCNDDPAPWPPDPDDANPPKHGVEFVAKETPTTLIAQFAKMAEDPSAVDAAAGRLTLKLSKAQTNRAGIWLLMATVWQYGSRKRQFPLLLEITPSLETDDFWTQSGGLTLAEIRLIMRDVCSEGNFLLDQTEYSDNEIAYMIRRPIDQWNEALPPVRAAHFTPMNFPFRYNWGEAVCGELLRMASTLMLREHLTYSAGNITVDTTGKWKDYVALADRRQEAWKLFIREKKVAINVAGGFASLGSYYGRGRW